MGCRAGDRAGVRAGHSAGGRAVGSTVSVADGPMLTPRRAPALGQLEARHDAIVTACQRAQAAVLSRLGGLAIPPAEHEALRLAIVEWALAEHARGASYEALRNAQRAERNEPR